MGSPERLVIGVVAVGASGFHVERANALDRFECLYGTAAETAVFAAKVALEDLEADCAERGMEALIDPRTSFSGVSIGNISEGEASSLGEVACTWMTSLSSLYNAGKDLGLELAAERELVDVGDGLSTERLPSLVFDYVKNRRPGFEQFFNEDIRGQQRRRRRSHVHRIIIDFAGSHLVANFGTLGTTHRAASIDRIKRRILDLMLSRDGEQGTVINRTHEIIVQNPSVDDPQITERQFNAIEDTISALSEQASVEDIGFQSMTNVPQIGNHVLESEAA